MPAKLTLALLTNAERKLFWGLIALCIIFMGLYVYFLSASVYNVVLRKETAIEISAVHSSISELESVYLQRKNDVTLPMAEGLGFHPIDEAYKTYVVRDAETNLTFNQ